MSPDEDSAAIKNLITIGFSALPPFKRKYMVEDVIIDFAFPDTGVPCLVISEPEAETITVLYDIQRGFFRLSAEIGKSHASHVLAHVLLPMNVGLYCRAYVKARWTPEIRGNLPRLSIVETYGSGRAVNELKKRGVVSPLVGVEISTSRAPDVTQDERTGDYDLSILPEFVS